MIFGMGDYAASCVGGKDIGTTMGTQVICFTILIPDDDCGEGSRIDAVDGPLPIL